MNTKSWERMDKIFSFHEGPSVIQTKESKRKKRSISKIKYLVPNETYRVAVRGFDAKVRSLSFVWLLLILLKGFIISDYNVPVQSNLAIVF